MCAWVDQHEGIGGTRDVLILSLGTGSVPHPVTYSRARRWGKVLWAQPAIGALLDGQADTTEFQMGQLLGDDQYLRLQIRLQVQNEPMDDASPTNIAALADAANRMLIENSDRLAAFCSRLTSAAQPTQSEVLSVP
jgi:hypothetical protein